MSLARAVPLFLAGFFLTFGLAVGTGTSGAVEDEKSADSARLDLHGDPLPADAVLRLGTVRFRHGGSVQNLRFLADNKSIVSYCQDGYLRVWEAESGKLLRKYRIGARSSRNDYYYEDMGFRNVRYYGRYRNEDFGTWTLSPDGLHLATFEPDNVVRIQELKTGKTVRDLALGQVRVHGLRFLPQANVIAGITQEKENNQTAIRFWDLATGKETRKFTGPEPSEDRRGQDEFRASGITFSPDGKTLAAMGNEYNQSGIIRFWDTANEKKSWRLLEQINSNGPALFSHDGKYMADVSTNPVKRHETSMRIYEVASGKEIRQFSRDRNYNLATFSPDGTYLAAGSGDRIITLWKTALEKEKEPLTISSARQPTDLAFSPSGKMLAIACDDGTVHIHDTEKGKEVWELKGHGRSSRSSNFWSENGTGLAFSPDGTTLAIPGRGHSIRVWDMATGKEKTKSEGPDGAIRSTRFSPDAKKAATAEPGWVRIWNTSTGKQLARLAISDDKEKANPNESNAGSDLVLEFAFAADSKTVAIASPDGRVQFHDTETGKQTGAWKAEGVTISCIDFATDGKQVITGDGSCQLVWWDIASGKELRRFKLFEGDASARPRYSPAYQTSPDWRTVAVTDQDNAISIRELDSGKRRWRFPGARGVSKYQLQYTPDGKGLAWVEGSCIRLLDLERGQEVRQFGSNGSVTGLTFTRDGKLLAASSSDGTVRVWDRETGTVVAHFQAHAGNAGAIEFAPDGRTLLTGGGDCTAMIWDVARCAAKWRTQTVEAAPAFEQLWTTLAGDDGTKVHDALNQLRADTAKSLPFIKEKLQPAVAPDQQKVEKLIADLGHDDYDTRNLASAELEKLGPLARGFLEKALESSADLEVTKRIKELLEKAKGPIRSPELCRAIRVLELLEKVGTAEAQAILKDLAKGAPEARLTQEARDTLTRLERK